MSSRSPRSLPIFMDWTFLPSDCEPPFLPQRAFCFTSFRMSTTSFTFLFPDTNSKSYFQRLISVPFLGLINLPSYSALDTSCSGELLSFCLSCPWALISPRFEAKYLSNSLMHCGKIRVQSSCCQPQHENTSQSISRPIFTKSPAYIPQD
jgi:hypothetical protein